MRLRMDKEFRALIPPLTDTERAELECSLLREGCRDSLVRWKDVLLDGHHRLAICTEHEIPYKTLALEFKTRDDAMIWIIKNQFARRNLTRFQRDELALKLKPLLVEQAKARMSEGGKGYQTSDTLVVNKELAKIAGTSHDSIHKSSVISESASEETKQALRRGETTVNAEYTKIQREGRETKRQAKRDENVVKVRGAETLEDLLLGGARFATIVMDPPWDWGDEGDVNQLGRAKHDYAGMPLQEIAELPIGRLAEDDCHLYLWITNRSLPKGFGLLDAWGFRYITCLTWAKPSIGMGNYFRGSTEQVLFAVKGSQPLARKDVGTWFEADRGARHSDKPDLFYEIAATCSPAPRLEAFGRKGRGTEWTVWGEDGIYGGAE